MKKSTIFMLLLAMALVRKGYERFFIDRTGSGAFSAVPQDHNDQINAVGFFRTWEGLSETQLINTRDEAIGPVCDWGVDVGEGRSIYCSSDDYLTIYDCDGNRFF